MMQGWAEVFFLVPQQSNVCHGQWQVLSVTLLASDDCLTTLQLLNTPLPAGAAVPCRVEGEVEEKHDDAVYATPPQPLQELPPVHLYDDLCSTHHQDSVQPLEQGALIYSDACLIIDPWDEVSERRLILHVPVGGEDGHRESIKGHSG